MSKRPSTKRRIMIVDDHKGITALWKVMLEKTGHYVVREENRSRQAVPSAHAFRPDLLILDMDMPDLDGSEVAAGVRADETIRATPIIFLTSLVSPQEAAKGKRIDGHPCLSKPTTVEGLVQVIEETLSMPCAA